MGKIILPGQEADTGSTARVVLTGFSDERDTGPVPVASPAALLYIDPHRLKRLPEEFQGFNCASCDRRNAGWAFLPTDKGPDPDPIPACSLCWFYVLGWARTRQEPIRAFLERYEVVTKKALRKDEDGRLLDHREADDALLQLYKASVMRDRLEGRAPRGARGG